MPISPKLFQVPPKFRHLTPLILNNLDNILKGEKLDDEEFDDKNQIDFAQFKAKLKFYRSSNVKNALEDLYQELKKNNVRLFCPQLI